MGPKRKYPIQDEEIAVLFAGWVDPIFERGSKYAGHYHPYQAVHSEECHWVHPVSVDLLQGNVDGSDKYSGLVQ